MQRYGAHEVDYLEFAPAPFEVFEDLLPMDAGGKELQVGACGAGAAGSESQPYLEGGIEAVDLFGGRLGGARCLRIGFGEDRGTRSLPGWALPVGLLWGGPWDTVPTGVGPTGLGLTGAARGWVARGRRVGRPGLQGDGGVRRGGFMSEVAIV